jgi:adenosylhomocysteine nucleosidase
MAEPRTVVLISANSEWRAVREILSPSDVQSTPLGETFTAALRTHALSKVEGPHTRPEQSRRAARFFHGGWGKISAAATAQYVIDHFRPNLLVNLGTCGGFAGRIATGAIILVTKTIVYDILEQMGDADEAIAHYATELDLSWLKDGLPSTVSGLLLSADRDIVKEDIPMLIEKYDAVAADWESGAIAWVAKKNGVRCLILRGVTDLVSPAGGEAYGNIEVFHTRTREIMKTLIEQLPNWLAASR